MKIEIEYIFYLFLAGGCNSKNVPSDTDSKQTEEERKKPIRQIEELKGFYVIK